MIAKIQSINGSKRIVIDGKPYNPVAFRSFRPVPANVNQFYRSGVRLFQILVSGRINAHKVPYSYYGGVWVGEKEYNFKALDNQIQMVKKFAPDAKIMVMIQLDPPLKWLEQHPGSPDSFNFLGEAALDEEWKTAATEYLNVFLDYAEEKYGEDIFAYAFAAGLCTEWFDSADYYTPSERRTEAFKKYSGGLDVPTKEELTDISGICMREPASKEAQYRNFACTLTPPLVKHFAKIIKDKTNRNKITGIFYGYTVNASVRLQINTSMLGYEEVWRDENIDMLFAPAGYTRMGDGTRDLGGASSYQFLIDSVALNNKLYLHEIDHGTHLSYFPIDNGTLLDFNNGYPDAQTTIEVLRRELATTLCKGGSLWWFDFMGNYYAAPEYAEEIAKQVKVCEKITNMPRESVADVAVFVDPMGYNLLKEGTNSTIDYVRFNLNALHKSGVAFESYNLSDITRLDLSRYKMLIFLYAPKLSDEIKEIINSNPDKLKVFIHLPDVASSGKIDLEAPTKLTDIKLVPHEGSGKVVYAESTFGFRAALSPLYSVADENAEIIASYENGEKAVAIKNGFAYIPVGNAPSTLWRDLASHAGAHIYTPAIVPVYTDSRFICCQFPGDKKDVIYLKEDGKYTEIFSGKKYKSKNKKIEFSHYNYQLMMFVKDK